MRLYTLSSRKIKYDDTYDVIVAGGGSACCTAAIAAAHKGAKTLLIEATGCLDGMGTMGLVPAWSPFSDKQKAAYRGIAMEVLQAAKDVMADVGKDDLDWVPIDPERLKVVYDTLVTKAGVAVLFNTFIGAVDAQDVSIQALIVSNKAGLTAYSAKVYVDCTGDAAGKTAVLAASMAHVDVHAVDVAHLRQQIAQDGDYIR